MATEWDMREGDNLLCLVTAEGGWGKTALLAGLVHQAVKVPIKSSFFLLLLLKNPCMLCTVGLHFTAAGLR